MAMSDLQFDALEWKYNLIINVEDNWINPYKGDHSRKYNLIINVEDNWINPYKGEHSRKTKEVLPSFSAV